MIYTEKDINKAIEFFLENLGEAHVVGLSGNLGAGKTTFTKNLLQKFGVVGPVPSPTFVLRRDYDLELKNFKKIIHIDAYRLEKPENLFQVISKEELSNEKNLILIEWPEKIEPSVCQKVFLFEHVGEVERKISC